VQQSLISTEDSFYEKNVQTGHPWLTVDDLNIFRPQGGAQVGQQLIGQLGLYYYKARFYSPTLGRFLQTDPIGYKDDMNLYAYVQNDPMNRVDPSGLYWFRQSWQTDFVVGREGEHSLVVPGDQTSRFIEDYVPAGRTFGEIHDSFVNAAVGAGVPDIIANIPSMIPMFAIALGTEVLRTLGILDQPTPEVKSTPCK